MVDSQRTTMTLFTQRQADILGIKIATVEYALICLCIDDPTKMMNFTRDKLELILEGENLDIMTIIALIQL